MNSSFVGRKDILTFIIDIILSNDNKSHFIPILGLGGTGKTMLINSLIKYFENDCIDNQNILVVNFDYRDLMSQSIAGTFLTVVLKFLSRYKNIITDAEIDDFTNILLSSPNNFERVLGFAKEKPKILEKSNIRTVLLEDTLEVINAPSQYIYQVFEAGSHLPNCVAIAAGRPEKNTTEHIKTISKILEKNGWIIHDPIELKQFSYSETETYINNCLYNSIPRNIVEKIYLLTGGSPIHLAITSEIFKRNAYLNLLDIDIEELRKLIREEPEMIHQKFEYELMAKISELRTTLDWSILYLSYINRRYDEKILKILLNASSNEVAELERKIKSLNFLRRSVLSNRQNKELLHDEMQRLVCKNIWDDIDNLGQHRMLLAKKVISEYYIPEIERNKKELEEIEIVGVSSSNVFKYIETIIIISELQNECLDYKLRVNTEDGLDYFSQLIEESEKSKHPNLVKTLLHDGVKNIGLLRYIEEEDLEKRIWKN